MHYDVAIIGAGMSGLAAGIRLAHFDRNVCIFERHYAYGGLNSYYTLDGRKYDVGLHAVTNFTPPEVRNAPLAKLFRQLRLSRDEFDLRPQRFSEIRYPDHTLRFSNDSTVLREEVASKFPHEADRFQRLLAVIRDCDEDSADRERRTARVVLAEQLADPLLIDMILCPILYYGSATEHDIDWRSFVVLFKSIILEGMARPRDGVRTIIRALVRKYRACGGKLAMRCGVNRIDVEDNRVAALTLDSGEQVTADVVISSAGYAETMRLCADGNMDARADDAAESPSDRAAEGCFDARRRLSFAETIAILDRPPAAFGHESTIAFYCDQPPLTYAVPDDFVDVRSGVICSPNNYEGHEDLSEGVFRVTWLANYDRWAALDDEAYGSAKRTCLERFLRFSERYVPGIRDHVIATDLFTPRTIERYTGHIQGAVYGAPRKRWDGRTHLGNLFLCGTDQGYLGIVGAMLSGITVANMHVLATE